MLKRLRDLRDMGFPEDFLDGYAEYRISYMGLSLAEREMQDFDYYLRMRYVEFLRKRI